MDTLAMDTNPDGTTRRMKFPRTKRDRYRQEGKLYESLSGTQLDGAGLHYPDGGPIPARTYDEVSMPQYPMPPPPQHNVTFDLPDQTNSSSATGNTSESCEPEDDDKQKDLGNNNKKGALTGTTFSTNRVPLTETVDNGDPRPWLQIQKAKNDDGTDSVPVLGPPGRTPPPQRKNFAQPQEEDEDDVFYDETVPEVVFNDEQHHPCYGNYIPGQYQHTLDYLYGLETIREVDESMIHQEHFKEKASTWDILCMLLTFLGYLVNIGADIWLAFEYFHFGHYVWFALTLLFVMLPSLAMTIFSLILYIQDQKLLKLKVSPCRWFLRSVFLVLLISPAMRIIDTIHYGVRSRSSDDWRERRRNYDRMRDEDTDSNLVRLFETFLENAPQLVLQLYVVAVLGTRDGTVLVVIQVFGLIVSLLTMAWSLVSFQAALRSSLPDKAEMNWVGKCLMFLWRLMTLSARVIAIALFASYFTFYVFAFLGGHFIFMFFWMAKQKTSYCMVQTKDDDGNEKTHHSKFLEFCFRAMAAFVHIFCFFNLLEGHTRLRCLVYYTIVYFENVVLILCWNFFASTRDNAGWYQMPALVIVFAGFFIGICFQIAYYLWAHPNHWSNRHRHKRIRLCVPWKELSLIHAIGVPGEEFINERKPVMEQNNQGPPGVRPPGVAPSDTGVSGVSSSVGPFVAPVETSTPAPSMTGFPPPQQISTPKTSPQYKPPPEEESPPVVPVVPHDRPTIDIQPIGAPPTPQPTPPTKGEKPIPAPRSRPSTPARELEVVRSRPTTPAQDLEKVETEV